MSEQFDRASITRQFEGLIAHPDTAQFAEAHQVERKRDTMGDFNKGYKFVADTLANDFDEIFMRQPSAVRTTLAVLVSDIWVASIHMGWDKEDSIDKMVEAGDGNALMNACYDYAVHFNSKKENTLNRNCAFNKDNLNLSLANLTYPTDRVDFLHAERLPVQGSSVRESECLKSIVLPLLRCTDSLFWTEDNRWQVWAASTKEATEKYTSSIKYLKQVLRAGLADE